MNYINIVLIALGLSMDACSVALINGAVKSKIKLTFAFKNALFFGVFQFFMPILGIILGNASKSIIYKFSHWISFTLLIYIGISMIYDSLKTDKAKDSFYSDNIINLILMAIATSIDAMATGIILPYTTGVNTINLIFIATLLIGTITFILSFIAVYIGNKFGTLLSSKSHLFGGIILISIGLKIIIEHYNLIRQ